MSLTLYEQETIINYNAEEQTAEVYTRDKTVMKKLDSLTDEYPEYYTVKESLGDYSKTYIMPKRFVKFYRPRNISAETRAKAAENLMKYHNSKALSTEC